jgi:hypothetical protein
MQQIDIGEFPRLYYFALGLNITRTRIANVGGATCCKGVAMGEGNGVDGTGVGMP